MNCLYLLDTNVISELAKPSPNPAVLKELKKNEDFCALSSVVWQETIHGYESMPEGKRKEKVWQYLLKIQETYQILPYDSFAAQICGELQARCERKGKAVPKNDSQIAATAIANNMVLVTHNVSDFTPMVEECMLHVEDWWA